MPQKAKTAFLFPGQGSQSVGMGKDIYEKYPAAKAVFERADKTLAFSLSELCFSGPETELTLTANTQPAVLTVSIALLKILQEETDINPDYVAGHSLGEYSALVCAGGLRFEDALRTVRQRGKFMQNAVPAGTGSMAAIMGMESGKLQKFCEEFSHEEIQVVIANRNCPGQYVISGHSEAVQLLMQTVQKAGALIFPLAVSAPFHSPLMKKAADDLAVWLESIPFNDTRVPLINNAEAEFLQKSGDLKASLIRQVMASVLWEDSMRTLIARGVETFIEIGPGKVLSGLMKRIDKTKNIINVSDITSLESAVAKLRAS